jgi:hypothetical protein
MLNLKEMLLQLQLNIYSELIEGLSSKITEQNIQIRTNNIIKKTPIVLIKQVTYFISYNIHNLILMLSPNMETQPFFDVINNHIYIISEQLHNILSNQVSSQEKIISDFMLEITKNNKRLDSALRLSEMLRNYLQQVSTTFQHFLLNNNDLVNEIKSFNDEIKIEYPTPQLVCPEYYQALEKICAYMCAVVQLTIVKTISESSGTNNSKLSISVEKKKK